jgi:hypothetical protein
MYYEKKLSFDYFFTVDVIKFMILILKNILIILFLFFC